MVITTYSAIYYDYYYYYYYLLSARKKEFSGLNIEQYMLIHITKAS